MTVSPSDILIEAVPNFSEGRRPEIVAAIVDAIRVPGVTVLDHSSDWDHNRSVVTVVGRPEAVTEGLFAAVAVAAREINLFEHIGCHPRLGATDVVPLVPIQNITLEACAQLARELGERIGVELQLPVYLYEAAATRPERRNLADVRRGEFEGLAQRLTQPEWQPDFGPSQAGQAGAVIVGARRFLIAYNFYLATDNLAIAQQISRAIRQSSGGLPGVKAMGMLVDGRAQVSMNLVDYTQTPLHVVNDEVARLAVDLGTQLDHAELIGLVPQEVIVQTVAHCLKLPDFSEKSILEYAIGAEL